MTHPDDSRALLQSWCDDHALTQLQLADLIGVQRSTLQRWLIGQPIPAQRRAWLARVRIAGAGERATLTVR